MPAPREASEFEQLMQKVFQLPRWQLYLLLAVLPPVCEELLCRGFLLSSFRARFGDMQAVLFSALLFGVLHLDVHRVPATAMAGLALGYIRVRTGSIAPAILFHMIYNGIIATPELHRYLDRPPLSAIAAAAVAVAGSALWLRLVEPGVFLGLREGAPGAGDKLPDAAEAAAGEADLGAGDARQGLPERVDKP
jgi:membrane protease YdiL (CAAX protease family)